MTKLSWGDIETNAIAFAKRWKDCEGNEKQQAQSFEKDLMSVFGVDWLEGLHEYQVYDSEGKIGYIDYLLPGKILIEMKSKGESLVRAYNQGYDYTKCLKPDEYPELLLVADFDYIQVTNLKTMKTFNKFKLNQLKKNVRMLGTLAGYNSEVTFKTDIEVNIDASYKMAKLHDALKDSGYVGENLEQYLVRLLFCMFAEDTGIFEEKAFENYIMDSKEDGSDLSARIVMLFETLNTDEKDRMTTLPASLNRFRYINGRLFKKTLPTAYFDSKMRKTLIDCCDFDWSYISPAIFGAMFQGVMDDKRRREMGAHYTDEENIMKVIKPLFLDELWEEFEKSKSTEAELETFHKKLSKLKFLDPACGCGNFLIITYRELRLLEFEVLKMLYDNRQMTIIDTFCKISIESFYGIEYEEFPSYIAQVAMLLMKHQMDKLVSNYFGMNIIDFPIKETANIVHGNALRIDWEDVVSKDELNYILGNPPFVGYSLLNEEQKEDRSITFKGFNNAGQLDYVACWYKKAFDIMQSSKIRAAFVSTNSICQGMQVAPLWEYALKTDISIQFAYTTFKWSNEAKGKASVHCVIVGFSYFSTHTDKFIEDPKGIRYKAKNINPYLIDGENIIIKKRSKPISMKNKCLSGNKAADSGFLILNQNEYAKLVKEEPLAKKYIKKYIGSKELLHDIPRYCLWLVDLFPDDLKDMPLIKARVEKVKDYRENAPKTGDAYKLRFRPSQFRDLNNPKTALVIPLTSSENRDYIPMLWVDDSFIISNANLFVENADLYDFGVLTSNVHMAWMRVVGSKLKSDYRYSNTLVYNNFISPTPDTKQKEKIKETAQNILNIRKLYSNYSLADMYNPLTMPTDLRKAHQNNDRAIWEAYGKAWNISSEQDCISHLMKLYQAKLNEN